MRHNEPHFIVVVTSSQLFGRVMKVRKTDSRSLKFAAAALAAVALIPLGASQATPSDVAEEVAPPQPAAEIVEPTFANQFEPYNNPPKAIQAPAAAVDISSFKPKIEAPPPPPPEPKAQGTVRSLGNGVASYYGKRFHGRLTANGERFNMNAMTAAHKTLPFGTKVRVTNPRNGRSVVVRINDRGPFIRGRTIDLSRGAAQKIGMISTGHARVKLEIVR